MLCIYHLQLVLIKPTKRHTKHAFVLKKMCRYRYWRQARTQGELQRDLRRNVAGMEGLVGLWGCDEGEGSALTDWTDNHACCLGRGGTEWIDISQSGVPVEPIRGHGRWELLAAVGLRPDFEEDEHELPDTEEKGGPGKQSSDSGGIAEVRRA